MPGTYIGIWETLSDNNIPILAMRDTPWLVRNGEPYFPADCLADGGDAISCGIKRSDVLSDHNPTLDFVAQFPLLKPLDMSDAVCRKDICRAVEGNVLLYHDAHHISTTYMRTMTNETRTPDRRGHRLVGRLMSSTEPAFGTHRLAGHRLPAGRHLRRCRDQLLVVLRGRRPGRAVPDRQGRHRGADQPRRGRRIRLARLPADRHPGSALRLPGARPVGSRGRAPLRPQQAAARSVRQVVPRRLRLQPGAVLLRPGGRRPRPPGAPRRRSTRSATR